MSAHKYYRRPVALLVVLAILLMPGGMLTHNVTADARLTAEQKQLVEEQKELLDPQASIDTETESKNPANNNQMTLETQRAMAAAPAPDTAQAVADQPTYTGGRWTSMPAFPKGTNAYHMVMGPKGKILLIAGSGNNAAAFKAGTFRAYMWSPTKGITKTIKVPEDMFCAGHMLLSDGRAIAAGGTKEYSPWKGETLLYTFDFTTEKFKKQDNMNHGRWYPTLVGTPGGSAIIVGGLNAGGRNAGTSEIFSVKTNQTRDLKGTQKWPLYPQIASTADHKYFFSGGSFKTNALQPGIWDAGTNTFKVIPGLAVPKQRTMAATCRVGDARNQDFVIIGGGWPATKSTNLINLNSKNPAYRAGPDLASAKGYVSCVQLPDGSVLELNGGSANKIAKASREVSLLKNAKSAAWMPMEPLPVGEHRVYHNAAFMMDDGSVISFGSNPSGETRSDTVLRYEPPYMFQDNRPTLTAVPAKMTYRGTYTVKVSPDVTKVTLVTAPSPTHSVDANQKQVTLPVKNGKITLDFNSLQFGRSYVRIFALNDQGVPSTALWSQLQ